MTYFSRPCRVQERGRQQQAGWMTDRARPGLLSPDRGEGQQMPTAPQPGLRPPPARATAAPTSTAWSRTSGWQPCHTGCCLKAASLAARKACTRALSDSGSTACPAGRSSNWRMKLQRGGGGGSTEPTGLQPRSSSANGCRQLSAAGSETGSNQRPGGPPHLLMLRTRSAACGSFIFARKSPKVRPTVRPPLGALAGSPMAAAEQGREQKARRGRDWRRQGRRRRQRAQATERARRTSHLMYARLCGCGRRTGAPGERKWALGRGAHWCGPITGCCVCYNLCAASACHPRG